MFEDFDLDNKKRNVAKIKIIGVGGGGNNAVNRMIRDGVSGLEFYVANTDKQVLENSPVPNKIVLGEDTTRGLGAGSNPEIGESAAIESEDEIRAAIGNSDLVFVAAGMGGGTGTGAAPIIAKIAKEQGSLVIGIVTTPFNFEGRDRQIKAKAGLEALYHQVDSIIIVSNDRLLLELGSVPIKDSFKYADAVLKQGVRTITDLIATPALINLDFADVRTILKDKGPALIGIGNAKGKDKAIRAAIEAINSPILEASIRGAKNAIVNVTGGNDVSINDANNVVQAIREASGQDINIIFGIMINEKLGDEIVVSVIASGLSKEIKKSVVAPKMSNPSQQQNNSHKKSFLGMGRKPQPRPRTMIEPEQEPETLSRPGTYSDTDFTEEYRGNFGVDKGMDETDDDIPFFLRNSK